MMVKFCVLRRNISVFVDIGHHLSTSKTLCCDLRIKLMHNPMKKQRGYVDAMFNYVLQAQKHITYITFEYRC